MTPETCDRCGRWASTEQFHHCPVDRAGADTVTPERLLEIRRAAALRCATELDATVTEDGYDSKTLDDWPDAAEREAFTTEVMRIVGRLYRQGGRT